jgi:hypothetical protein
MLPQTGCPRHTGCSRGQWGPQSGEQAEPLPLCNAVTLGRGRTAAPQRPLQVLELSAEPHCAKIELLSSPGRASLVSDCSWEPGGARHTTGASRAQQGLPPLALLLEAQVHHS